MGDEEDGLALGGQISHDLHQLVDLLRSQHGGGFIEDQHIIFPVEHLQDLGTLLHTHGDILYQCVGVNMQAVFLAQLQHLLPRLLLLQEAQLTHRLHAHDDIVQYGEAFHQLEVLVHHADAQVVGIVGVADAHLLPVHADLALFRLIQAEQHAHQGRLAGTVFTQQGVDLALFKLQGDVIIGDDTGEALGNVQHFYYIVFHFSANLLISGAGISDSVGRPGKALSRSGDCTQ